MAKEKKQRSDHYDPKLAIKGSFLDVIKVVVKERKIQTKKAAKKKE